MTDAECKIHAALMRALQRNEIDIEDDDAIVAVLDTCLIATQEDEGVWRVPVQCPWTEDAAAKAQVMIHAREGKTHLSLMVWKAEYYVPDRPDSQCDTRWDYLVNAQVPPPDYRFVFGNNESDD